ncbi:unannotated protein [freshwater metagenome]|uniref:Unannotated protein n=1 Tax=freshwater metagenome TaxID=449393 RepID=A0A6J6QLI0_9ZZZZ
MLLLLTINLEIPGVGCDKSTNYVEDGRLARTVGADESSNRALGHPDAHAIEDLQPA